MSKFELRYAQACVAREVDDRTRKRGQLRRSKASDETLAQRLDMDSRELKGHLEDGRLWNSVCGPFDGLLPFVLIDSSKPLYTRKKEWRRLRAEQLEAFHGLLKDAFTEEMCRTGVTFQDITARGSNQVFQWENEKLDLTCKDWASLLSRTGTQTDCSY